MLAALLAACSHGGGRVAQPVGPTVAARATAQAGRSENPRPAVTLAAGASAIRTPLAVPSSKDLFDVGQVYVPDGHPVQASNRTTLIVLQVAAGDLFRVPIGARAASPPGVALNPEYALSFLTAVKGQSLYVYVQGAGGRRQFAPMDGGVYEVLAGGDVLISTFGGPSDTTTAVEHTSAINPFGHLLIDPSPVPASAVVYYNTGEGLDVRAAQRAGALPRDIAYYVRTVCDDHSCFLFGADDRAPLPGTIGCGDTVSLLTDRLRLTFERAPVPSGKATPVPGPCEQGRHVDAGERVAMLYTPVYVRAFSLDGQPLSIVAAGDGTLYAGNITPKFTCGPCRGK